jgi:hypothetical protein
VKVRKEAVAACSARRGNSIASTALRSIYFFTGEIFSSTVTVNV